MHSLKRCSSSISLSDYKFQKDTSVLLRVKQILNLDLQVNKKKNQVWHKDRKTRPYLTFGTIFGLSDWSHGLGTHSVIDRSPLGDWSWPISALFECVQNFQMWDFAYKIILRLTLVTIGTTRTSKVLEKEKERSNSEKKRKKGADLVKVLGNQEYPMMWEPSFLSLNLVVSLSFSRLVVC